MPRIFSSWMLFLSLTLAAGHAALAAGLADLTAGHAAAITCPRDAVPVGTVCVDKYEASVWNVPGPTGANRKLVAKVRKGTATLEDLVAGGATQLGCGFPPFDHDLFPASFPHNGNWTPVPGSSPPRPGIYAASIPGVIPSACVSWFQSQQACLLSDKRLLTNAEWQAAAAGTPDPGNVDDGSTTCVTNSAGPDDTGSRTSCKSNWGASDMVGNVNEWVADWVPRSTACPGWFGFSDDRMCGAGASETNGPGALRRGGDWNDNTTAGVFAVDGQFRPAHSESDFSGDFSFGLRCAR